MKSLRKILLPIGLCLAVIMAAAPFPAGAMKALSDDDLGGVSGSDGISIFGQNVDMTIIQAKGLEIYLSRDIEPVTSSFRITSKRDSVAMFLTSDMNVWTETAGALFCGSPTDPNKPINFDTFGFEIDVHVGDMGDTSPVGGGLTGTAKTVSLVGYGSFDAYMNFQLVQFVPNAGAGVPVDVFGLGIGPWTWAHRYGDNTLFRVKENPGTGTESQSFMRALVSPLESFENNAFYDSNLGAWNSAITTRAQIRSSAGLGGEFGAKIGSDGRLAFFGFNQEAYGSSIMMAGAIIDEPVWSTAAGRYYYPTWKTNPSHSSYAGTPVTLASYYSDDLADWYVTGTTMAGVHHRRTYDRSNYLHANYVQSRIGQTSNARPLRIELASTYRANQYSSPGNPDYLPADRYDTYLVMYISGHYTRSTYHPDSMVSTMGTSSGAVVAPVYSGGVQVGARKDYILGDLRVGRTSGIKPGATPPAYHDPTNQYGWLGAQWGGWPAHLGAWALNDVSVEYGKIVIPGGRPLTYEVSAASENFLIPNLDYNGLQINFRGFWGNSTGNTDANTSPTTVNRTMHIAGCFNGATSPNPTNAFWGGYGTSHRTHVLRTGAYWNN